MGVLPKLSNQSPVNPWGDPYESVSKWRSPFGDGQKYYIDPSGRAVDPQSLKRKGNYERTGATKIGKKEYLTLKTAQDINRFGQNLTGAMPKYQTFGAPDVQNMDADVVSRFREDAYRAPGAGSAWLGFGQQNVRDQLSKGLAGLGGAQQGQLASAWSRMGQSGLRGGAQERTGYKAGLAGALAGQGLVSSANQYGLDLAAQDEQNRLKDLAAAPEFETAATEGSRFMAGQGLAEQQRRMGFGEGLADVRQETDAARKLGLASLDQGQLNKLRQKGIKI